MKFKKLKDHEQLPLS
ncbi:rCG49689 [Rattus norvegicus]|uniref:RCG49689 n=1 Tax=Rattus norvegicus TaxID=10116 RepID=A6K2P5_RAT|nr:rCG49689 [Rattus norvegicus]